MNLCESANIGLYLLEGRAEVSDLKVRIISDQVVPVLTPVIFAGNKLPHVRVEREGKIAEFGTIQCGYKKASGFHQGKERDVMILERCSVTELHVAGAKEVKVTEDELIVASTVGRHT